MSSAFTGIQIGPRQLELPPNMPVSTGWKVIHAVFLTSTLTT
jgi:hypothetical protein